MVTLMVRHTIADYTTFRPVFDADKVIVSKFDKEKTQ